MKRRGELSVYLPPELYKALENHSKKLALSKSATARMIINGFFMQKTNGSETE